MVSFPYSAILGLHSAQGQGQISDVARHHTAWPPPHRCLLPCSRGSWWCATHNAGTFAVTKKASRVGIQMSAKE